MTNPDKVITVFNNKYPGLLNQQQMRDLADYINSVMMEAYEVGCAETTKKVLDFIKKETVKGKGG